MGGDEPSAKVGRASQGGIGDHGDKRAREVTMAAARGGARVGQSGVRAQSGGETAVLGNDHGRTEATGMHERARRGARAVTREAERQREASARAVGTVACTPGGAQAQRGPAGVRDQALTVEHAAPAIRPDAGDKARRSHGQRTGRRRG
jgi:hypothetical protein